MRNRKRLFALLLCVGLLMVLAVSSAFIVLEARHACCGRACKICDFVAKTEALLRGMACLMVLSLFAARLLPALRALAARGAWRRLALDTLVCWKVRLNN